MTFFIIRKHFWNLHWLNLRYANVVRDVGVFKFLFRFRFIVTPQSKSISNQNLCLRVSRVFFILNFSLITYMIAIQIGSHQVFLDDLNVCV